MLRIHLARQCTWAALKQTTADPLLKSAVLPSGYRAATLAATRMGSHAGEKGGA
jgi:hypothetical protein